MGDGYSQTLTQIHTQIPGTLSASWAFYAHYPMPAAISLNKIPFKLQKKTMFKHQYPKRPQPIVHLNAGKTKRRFSIRNNVQEVAQ